MAYFGGLKQVCWNFGHFLTYRKRGSIYKKILYTCRALFSYTSCNSYTKVCPPVQGDNPQALASGLP